MIWRRPAALALCLAAGPALLVPPAAGEDFDAAIARGDRAWERRTEGHQGDRARPGPIGEAVDAYSRALEARPSSFEARRKLMRALYYQGEHAIADSDAKLAVFERGRELAEAALDELGARVGGREALDRMSAEEIGARLGDVPEAAPTFYWAAVHWGLWGRHKGKIAAARQGVAKKIRDLAEALIAIDERHENAGGRRILGRLHTEAPKLPFFTGWVDRGKAVSELERAHELFPDDLGLRLYLAEALLEFRPERKQEALDMLRALIADEPHPDFLLEGLGFQEDARALLDKHS